MTADRLRGFRCLLPPVCLVLAIGSLARLSLAQESRVPIEVPTTVRPISESIETVSDFDGDGDFDAMGFVWLDTPTPTARFQAFRHLFGDTRFQPLVGVDLGGSTEDWTLEPGRFDPTATGSVVFSVGENLALRRFDATLQQAQIQQLQSPFPVRVLAVADFDGDGQDGFLIGGANGSVLAYASSAPSGVAPIGTPLSLGSDAVFGLEVADLDADGSVEVLAAAGPLLFVLGVSVAGGITVEATLAHGVDAIEEPRLTVGDIDGDGDVDVVVFASATGDYATLRNVGSGSLSLEGRVVGGPATDLVDVDGDGDLDGVGGTGPGGSTTTSTTERSLFHVSIFEGGTFRPAWEIPAIGGKRLAGAVDLDGDGDIDLIGGRTIVYDRGETFSGQHGFGNGEPLPLIPAPVPPIDARVTDLEGDGDLDLVTGAGGDRWRNDGMGRLEHEVFDLPGAPVGTSFIGPGILGDFDGDGLLDAVVAHVDDASGSLLGMRLLLNRGGRYLDRGYAAAGVDFHAVTDLGAFGAYARAGDLDGDGDVDIAAGVDPSAPGSPIAIRTWFNDGAGSFTLAQTFAGFPPRWIGDFDLDGFVDIVTFAEPVPPGSGTIELHRGSSGGFVGPVVHVASPAGFGFAVADVDGNSLPDVVYVAPEVGLLVRGPTVAFNLGTSFTHSSVFLDFDDLAAIQFSTADLDGDGDADLVTRGGGSEESAALMVDLGLAGGGPLQFDTITVPVSAGVAFDADGDGDVDLVGDRFAGGTEFDGLAAGSVRQYGPTVVGAGGIAPTLGAGGAVRVGETTTLRIVGAVGGAPGIFVLGGTERNLVDFPFPGLTFLAEPLVLLSFGTSGAAGLPGVGSSATAVTWPSGFEGGRLYGQAFVLDLGAPGLFSQTNGLEIVVGQ